MLSCAQLLKQKLVVNIVVELSSITCLQKILLLIELHIIVDYAMREKDVFYNQGGIEGKQHSL